MKTYIVTLSTDSGPYALQTVAQNRNALIQMVMAIENCPRRAIKFIECIKKLRK